MVDDTHGITEAIYLVAIMGNVNCPSRKRTQRVAQLKLKLPAKITVECREGLVEQNKIGLAGKNTCHGTTLLLTAGKLMGATVKKTLKPHFLELCKRTRFTLCLCCSLGAHQHILHHAHVREECIALKQISNTPLLRRHINMGF